MRKVLGAHLLCCAAIAQVLPPTVATSADSAGHALFEVHNNSADRSLSALAYEITFIYRVSGKIQSTSARFLDSQTNPKIMKLIPPHGDASFDGFGSSQLKTQLAFGCAVFNDDSAVGDGLCVKRLFDRRSAQRNIVQAVLNVLNDPVLSSTSPAKIVAAVDAARSSLVWPHRPATNFTYQRAGK